MDIRQLSSTLSVSPQLRPGEMDAIAGQGFKTLINNRPDGEADDQPSSAELRQAAQAAGLAYRDVPVVSGKVTDADADAFAQALADAEKPVLAFCRTGTRSAMLWALSQAATLGVGAVLEAAAAAGYDLAANRPRLEARAGSAPGGGAERGVSHHQIVIIGGGAAGIATAASLLKRRSGLDIAIVEPREQHFYQPGWTLVGGGVFDRAQTARPMADVIPKGATWIQNAAAEFAPDRNEVILEDGQRLGYSILIVAPGIKLDWEQVDGLKETLGKNGVTSNYHFDMAPYTWELIQGLKSGRAIFTQPPMPIKCAGAPQKAMYLACDYWLRQGRLKDIRVDFCNAGAVLFGIPAYLPALNRYVERYGINLNFGRNLVAVDGAKKTAVFEVTKEEGATERQEEQFDMMHVCPPQSAPDFLRKSPLADEGGWVDVDQETLQHSKYDNVFGVGDACSAPNAKTAAAVRKQAPTVATNVLAVLDGKGSRAIYDGYGSCPLTVERGKIVLAEFGYGGKLLPTFPSWLVDGTKPTRLAWFLKEKMLPSIYWNLMLRGHEWLVELATRSSSQKEGEQ